MAKRLRLQPQFAKHSKSYKTIIDTRRLLRKTRLTPIEIQTQAREFGKDALKALAEIVNSVTSSEPAKIAAAQTILDRAYGRPTQTNITASVGNDGSTKEITDQELNRRIAETLRATEALTRAAGVTKRKREKIKSEEGPADLRKLH